MESAEQILALPKQMAEKYGTGETWQPESFFLSHHRILELRSGGEIIGYIGHAQTKV